MTCPRWEGHGLSVNPRHRAAKIEPNSIDSYMYLGSREIAGNLLAEVVSKLSLLRSLNHEKSG